MTRRRRDDGPRLWHRVRLVCGHEVTTLAEYGPGVRLSCDRCPGARVQRDGVLYPARAVDRVLSEPGTYDAVTPKRPPLDLLRKAPHAR